MKAIVYAEYGPPDVLELREVETPTPGDVEVRIQIHAAAANYADWALLTGRPFLVRLMTGGPLKPRNRILGADVAGRVDAVGKQVTQFQPGDEVFGDISDCGWGAFAEHTCARENALALKPANLSFEEAAAVPFAAVTALQGLRDKGKIRPGQKVLINGASGGVGTFAVQIAKALGAEVTAVCSTRNLDTARAIGADRVIDYTQTDFTQNGQRYDLILAANGHRSLFDYKRALTPHGVYVCTGGSLAQIFQSMFLGPLISMTGSRKMGNHAMRPNKEDLLFMKDLLASGKVRPVIDRRYTLSQVAEALQYLGTGHARGKIVVTMQQDNKSYFGPPGA